MAEPRRNLFKNGAYLQSSTTLFVFFASWGIWWSFFSTWLDKTLGLSGGEIGMIYSVNWLFTDEGVAVDGGVGASVRG